MTPPRSQCCGAELCVTSSQGTRHALDVTSYYVCSKCGRPCDPAAQPAVGERERLRVRTLRDEMSYLIAQCLDKGMLLDHLEVTFETRLQDRLAAADKLAEACERLREESVHPDGTWIAPSVAGWDAFVTTLAEYRGKK